MKFLSILPLLALTYKVQAATYSNCKGCKVVVEEDGVNYGVENRKWCIIDEELCDSEVEDNKCFSFPDYPCCEGCSYVYEDENGQWGLENKQWCGIKDSCFDEEDSSEDDEETETPETEEETETPEAEELFCKNPIVTHMYTADPAPMVYGDTLYLFTTHDEDEIKNDFYTMENWHLFSTKDMVNWESHGQILSLDDVEWADDRAWAPQCIERNGKFYFYFPAHTSIGEGGMAIGVAVANNPLGPYKDIGEPLVYEDGEWNDFDPTVFIDDDGKAYLYFGNPELRYVVLNEDMVSYDQEIGIVKVPMTEESFGKGGFGGSSYVEGPWIYKREGIYYLSYAAFREGQMDESIGYATSDSPTGPWKYGGTVMDEKGGIFTNHPGIIDFKGKSYLFYHTGELPGGSLFHRSVCVKEFKYGKDGSIDTISKCPQHTEL